MRAFVNAPTPGGCHATTTLPVRPLRRGMGHSRTAAQPGRKARPTTQVACTQGRGRRVLPALRSDCSWRMLPREYPPWQTVYYHFRRRRIDGRLRRAHDRLREEVREAEGRDRNLSAAVIDSQVVKTTRVGGLRAWLRRSEASRRTQAPHPGGHQRAGVGCEGP